MEPLTDDRLQRIEDNAQSVWKWEEKGMANLIIELVTEIKRLRKMVTHGTTVRDHKHRKRKDN